MCWCTAKKLLTYWSSSIQIHKHTPIVYTAAENLMTVVTVGSCVKVAVNWSAVFLFTLVQSCTHVDAVQNVLVHTSNDELLCHWISIRRCVQRCCEHMELIHAAKSGKRTISTTRITAEQRWSADVCKYCNKCHMNKYNQQTCNIMQK